MHFNYAAIRSQFALPSAKLGSAAIMGFAIAGMHYTGMAAAHFAADSICLAAAAGGLHNTALAIGIGAGTLVILCLTLIVSALDAHFAFSNARLARELEKRTSALEQSREMFKLMAESTRAVPFTLDLTAGCFTYIGAQGIADSGIPESEWHVTDALQRVIPRESNLAIRQQFETCQDGLFEFACPSSGDRQMQRSALDRHVRNPGRCKGAARPDARHN